MAEANTGIPSTAIPLLSLHLEEIAITCNILKTIGHRLVEDGADEVLSAAVISLAERTGWRADNCLDSLNQGQCVGEYYDWIAPPAEKKANDDLVPRS